MGEDQKVLGQRGGAFRPGARQAEETLQLREAPLRQPRLHQVEAAEHAGQHIVEVVRDAAGELAHRIHLLRLGQGGGALPNCPWDGRAVLYPASARMRAPLRTEASLTRMPRPGPSGTTTAPSRFGTRSSSTSSVSTWCGM